jgi:hypothetical protein
MIQIHSRTGHQLRRYAEKPRESIQVVPGTEGLEDKQALQCSLSEGALDSDFQLCAGISNGHLNPSLADAAAQLNRSSRVVGTEMTVTAEHVVEGVGVDMIQELD